MLVVWGIFMEALKLDYKVRAMHKLDDTRVYNFLKNEVEINTLAKEIKEHIRKGICYKLQNEKGEIKGVFMAMQYKEHTSLSYYLLSDEVRMKPIGFKLFLIGMSKLNQLLPIFVKKNKNYDTYRNYFKELDDEYLLFQGLRQDKYIKELENIL